MTDTATGTDAITSVRDKVDTYLDTHEHIICAEAAAELIRQWDGTGLLEAWLRTRAPEILSQYIYERSLRRGARKARANRASAFAQFRDGFEETLARGDVDGARAKATEFYRFHTVTEDGAPVRKPFRALNAEQLDEVRKRYQRQSDESGFYARIIEAVQKRVERHGPGATVADVYTPEQLQEMFKRGE